MKSTKLLMADHESIFQALYVLDAINNDVKDGKYVDHDDVRSLLSFLREFADGCHDVKEEAIFFPALMQAGMALDEGPLRVMTYEHERGRALIAAMDAAMDDAMSRNKKDEFLVYSTRYVDLLSQHIEKENWVLFDKADQILSDEDDQKIAEALEHYENVIVGAAAHARWRQTIEVLASKYLAAPVRS